MPGMSGIECARRLKVAMPQLKIIVVSGLQDEDSMDKSLDAGADAYLIKPFSVEECLAILKFVVRNLIPATRNSDELRESSGFEPNLTVRQNQVMQLLSNGFVPKEIPDELGISYWAAHKHKVSSYRKLGAHTLIEALRKIRYRNCP